MPTDEATNAGASIGALSESSKRVLSRHIVRRLYPKETAVFDLIYDATIANPAIAPSVGSAGVSIGGLPYGSLPSLGTPQVVAYLGTIFVLIAEMCASRSITVEQGYHLFVKDPKVQEEILMKDRPALTANLRLDALTRRQMLEDVIGWIGPIRFQYGAGLPVEEGEGYEFKRCGGGNPVREISNQCERYAVAFLNAGWGSIYWGIEPDGPSVTGVKLNADQRDSVKRKVPQQLARIRPAIDPTTHYRVEIHPVFGPDEVPPNLYVVELTIPLFVPTVVYEDHSGNVYAKAGSETQHLDADQVRALEQARASRKA